MSSMVEYLAMLQTDEKTLAYQHKPGFRQPNVLIPRNPPLIGSSPSALADGPAVVLHGSITQRISDSTSVYKLSNTSRETPASRTPSYHKREQTTTTDDDYG